MLLTPPDSSTNRYPRKQQQQQQMPSMLDTSGNGNLGRKIKRPNTRNKFNIIYLFN